MGRSLWRGAVLPNDEVAHCRAFQSPSRPEASQTRGLGRMPAKMGLLRTLLLDEKPLSSHQRALRYCRWEKDGKTRWVCVAGCGSPSQHLPIWCILCCKVTLRVAPEPSTLHCIRTSSSFRSLGRDSTTQAAGARRPTRRTARGRPHRSTPGISERPSPDSILTSEDSAHRPLSHEWDLLESLISLYCWGGRDSLSFRTGSPGHETRNPGRSARVSIEPG